MQPSQAEARQRLTHAKYTQPYEPGFLGGAGGALGAAGGALGGMPPGAAEGGGAPAAEAETPGGGGALGSSAPQLLQTAASGGLTVSHLGHLFSFFCAVGGLKHIFLLLFLGRIRKQSFLIRPK
jgi:hypothetical protein